MNAGQCERLQESLTRLRLFKSRERLEALLQAASSEELISSFSSSATATKKGR